MKAKIGPNRAPEVFRCRVLPPPAILETLKILMKALLAMPQQEERFGDTALELLSTTQKIILSSRIPEHSGSKIKKHSMKLILYLILALIFIRKIVLEKD